MSETNREIEVRSKQLAEREGTREGPLFVPEVDIAERPEGYEITADLPGVDGDDVKIELENGLLSIDAASPQGPQMGWRLVHQEYHSGGYHRSFRMTDQIDSEGIEAHMKDGVLTLRLPKVARHQPRQIQVSHD